MFGWMLTAWSSGADSAAQKNKAGMQLTEHVQHPQMQCIYQILTNSTIVIIIKCYSILIYIYIYIVQIQKMNKYLCVCTRFNTYTYIDSEMYNYMAYYHIFFFYHIIYNVCLHKCSPLWLVIVTSTLWDGSRSSCSRFCWCNPRFGCQMP